MAATRTRPSRTCGGTAAAAAAKFDTPAAGIPVAKAKPRAPVVTAIRSSSPGASPASFKVSAIKGISRSAWPRSMLSARRAKTFAPANTAAAQPRPAQSKPRTLKALGSFAMAPIITCCDNGVMALEEVSPQGFDVLIDIAYATPDNFTGRPVYARPGCYLHADAAEALKRAVALANPLGYRL